MTDDPNAMVMVKTTSPHENAYGDRPNKEKGDGYAVPKGYADLLVGQKLVERVKAPAPAPTPASTAAAAAPAPRKRTKARAPARAPAPAPAPEKAAAPK